jgi:hypothetical protein
MRGKRNMRLNNVEATLLRQGDIFRAYKEFRLRTGASLLEAKNLIEKSGERMGLMKLELCKFCNGRGKITHWDHDKFMKKVDRK